jgi:septal ring factor EnvC (AmiA/AmiB activator)
MGLSVIAKNQNTFAKQQREMEKRRKASEKRARRSNKTSGDGTSTYTPPPRVVIQRKVDISMRTDLFKKTEGADSLDRDQQNKL